MRPRSAKSAGRLLPLALLIAMALALAGSAGYGQVRSGAAFLKMLPGARTQGMGNTYTGMYDDLNAVLANPASAGFLRHWQWTLNYSKWFADVYNASFFYGQTFATPWARRTTVTAGIVVQGMAPFNSVDRPALTTDAGDQLFILNVGQPLDFLSRQMALGASAKYLRSRLDRYQAGAWVVDAGMFYRSPLFNMPAFLRSALPRGFVTAGFAVTQLGRPITFLQQGTPLPLTWRGGVHWHAGEHHGLTVQVGVDWQSTRDDGDQINLGAEVTWRDLLTLRAGYFVKQPENHLLDRLNAGISFRIDDRQGQLLDVLPGRNKALRLDIAGLGTDDLFSSTYRGSVAHMPIGPTPFTFLQPEFGTSFETDSVRLQWSAAEDPDPYDAVTYWLFADTSRHDLARLVEEIDLGKKPVKLVLEQTRPLIRQVTDNTTYTFSARFNGRYYWTVVAIDRDYHARIIEKDGRRIGEFQIRYPDLRITRFDFRPQEWITTDDYQGLLEVDIVNDGHRSLSGVTLVVYDSTQVMVSAKNGHTMVSESPAVLYQTTLAEIAPYDTVTVVFEWHTHQSGLHDLVAVVDPEQQVRELHEDNNIRLGSFYTVPKGTITAEDTSTAIIFSRVTYDLPFTAEVCFDSSDTRVKTEYVRGDLLPAPLTILAERLKANPQMRISIQGAADPNSGEFDVALADARARAVRDTLLAKGVAPDQIVLLPGVVLPRRSTPRNPEDARWVFEERRYVRIYAQPGAESTLFQPMKFTDVEPLSVPVTFLTDLHSAVGLRVSKVVLKDSWQTDTLDLASFNRNGRFFGIVGWRYPLPERLQEQDWSDRMVHYQVVLVDSLGRRFSSPPDSLFLTANSVLRDEKYAWPLKFAQTDPLYDFYWNKLFSHVTRMLEDRGMRMRFVGHACAVGPVDVNQRLSERRAERFQSRFLEYVRTNYPASYRTIVERLDPPIGRGENVPLNIQHTSGRVIILGDNNSPLGRKLNRRIEIDFYSPERPLQETIGARH